MNILALNIGENTGWAVYSEQKAKKITHGRFVSRKDKSESEEDPYSRFRSLLQRAVTDNDIEKIYYQESSDETLDSYHLCLNEIEGCSSDNLITYEKLSSKQVLSEIFGERSTEKDILTNSMIHIGQLPKEDRERLICNSPEDEGEALAIIMAYYASKKSK
jgi:hypothetical protein